MSYSVPTREKSETKLLQWSDHLGSSECNYCIEYQSYWHAGSLHVSVTTMQSTVWTNWAFDLNFNLDEFLISTPKIPWIIHSFKLVLFRLTLYI